MEIKHTPGPWTVDNEDGRTIYSAIGSEIAVTSLRPKEVMDDGSLLNRKVYNAKLIAAAPDMLDALITAKDAIDDLMDIADGYDKDLEKVLAAIKKATSEI